MYRFYFVSGKDTLYNFKSILEERFVDTYVLGTNNANIMLKNLVREYKINGLDALIFGNIVIPDKLCHQIAHLLSTIQMVDGNELNIFIYDNEKDMSNLCKALNKYKVTYILNKTELSLANLETYTLFRIYRLLKSDIKKKNSMELTNFEDKRFYR